MVRVALHETQAVHAMTPPAELNATRIEIEAGVARRSERPREPRSTAAMAAANFQNIFPAQIDLRGDVVIELNAGAVRLVRGIEWQRTWRIFLESVVQEQDVVFAQTTREEGIPELPDGSPHAGGAEEMIDEGHA